MKRVRCPKCDNYITFDETKYPTGQSLVFKCNECGKEFGIRIGVSKLRSTQKEESKELDALTSSLSARPSVACTARNQPSSLIPQPSSLGYLIVIENVFHYKQVLPLHMGDNVIGRYQKGNPANCTFETVDPSVDLNHCTVNVSHDKRGGLRYTLIDNNSNTGTFVGDVELHPRERRIIEDGTLFTLGATSIILRTSDIEEDHA
jgi:DNA-directed RNA polymerase subunit RPC12/RpoP